MSMEQYLQSDINEDGASLQNWKSLNSTTTLDPSSGGFECNICLDLVQDPVVTFCGHLYCWPCIYRWINFRDENLDQHKPQCPVCKTDVSEKTLIPLYGRGSQTTSSFKDNLTHLIPQRPSSPRCTISNRSSPVRHPSYAQPSRFYHASNYTASPMLGNSSTTHLVDPMIGMFGEMVYARIFGNSETTLYTYPNSYNLAGSSSPRMRRHMMQTDKSLSRVCFFLCCCVLLCLLLF